jgi:hypothetical protein
MRLIGLRRASAGIAGMRERLVGRLLSGTGNGRTAFIQAGQPASPAPWNACTRALAGELVPFPAP